MKAAAAVLAAPNGRSIGSVRPGVELRVLETRGAYAKVSVGGYVERTRLSAKRGSKSPRVGNRATVVRARGTSTARTVASFDAGTIVALDKSAAPKGWVRVSRDAWVLKSALEIATRTASSRAATERPVASTKPVATPRSSGGDVEAPAPAVSGSSSTAPVPASMPESKPAEVPAAGNAAPDSMLATTANVALRTAPDARPLATIAAGATLTPLARDRGWVRVRLEGWVQEREVVPADTLVQTGLSAADLRADPSGSRGKLVRWSVQVLASQKADALRRDLNPDEVYLLARGPYEENALLYLVVPVSLLPAAKSIPELSQAMITARVRTGRSELVGVPILDLLTIIPKK